MGDADGPVCRGPHVAGRHPGPVERPAVPAGGPAHRPRAGDRTDRLIVRSPAMPAPDLILDPSTLDLTRVIADREAIRRVNPHRGHMEHLTAVVHMDTTAHVIAGYKDVRPDEF